VDEAAAVIAPLQGLDAQVVKLSIQRYEFNVTPLTPAVVARQQQIADAFHGLKLIPKTIRIADAVPAKSAL
jgi:sulfonate transport system substrate-binding protein